MHAAVDVQRVAGNLGEMSASGFRKFRALGGQRSRGLGVSGV